ncbi:hypothetical protein Y032_0539g3148 [Ancylostoma ceylanicum]|uniref:Uncharacterized protein n=1 Tax=Ancylostoma ceylanicum TaxID=53326 RepID=A0A016WSE9_9BILA|nr:hypothetical protein Y032_0539g3148 [Ancylostoma ceylanicum]
MGLYDLLDWRWHNSGRVALDGVGLSKASNGSDMTWSDDVEIQRIDGERHSAARHWWWLGCGGKLRLDTT